jgi:hypothetical protein
VILKHKDDLAPQIAELERLLALSSLSKSQRDELLQELKAMRAGACCANVNAFISHSHVDRAYGAQAKSVLAEFDIESFLAHEDLEVSEEWQARILSELRWCDLFVHF